MQTNTLLCVAAAGTLPVVDATCCAGMASSGWCTAGELPGCGAAVPLSGAAGRRTCTAFLHAQRTLCKGWAKWQHTHCVVCATLPCDLIVQLLLGTVWLLRFQLLCGHRVLSFAAARFSRCLGGG
jgi:hypothetical protein